MKHLFLLLLSIAMFIEFSDAQGLKIKTDKKDAFSTNTNVTLIFETNTEVDSLGKTDLQPLVIISGPNKNTSLSIINGKTEHSYSLTYIVQSPKPGEFKINAPVIYSKGKKYEGDAATLKFAGNELSEAEIQELQFKKLRSNSVKPDGTTRIVFYENIGYVEKYKDGEWQFGRNLNEAEIKNLSVYKQ